MIGVKVVFKEKNEAVDKLSLTDWYVGVQRTAGGECSGLEVSETDMKTWGVRDCSAAPDKSIDGTVKLISGG